VLEGTHRRGEELARTSTVWKDPGRAADQATGDWDVTGSETARSAHLWVTRGLEREEVDEVRAGDIVWINGPADIMIGDTLSSPELADPALPPLEIEEPTVSMFFLVNNGPFSGREGQAVTLRQIKDRLERELRVNVALRVEDLGRPDGVKVSGRGELHLGILIEEMRREGMELCVSRPEVITHTDDKGRLLEPMEQLTIDVPNEYQGIVIEKLAQRKGEITAMHDAGTGVIRLEFTIPTRGLIGYRGDFLTDTRGLGIMASRFTGYEPWRGEVAHRDRGSLVSMENGPATGYSLENLQQRGTLFVTPMDPVYNGMIVGEHSRSGDLACNPCKAKKLGNYRAETKEVDVGLKVPRLMTLDQALEWVSGDELVEITPKSVRVRKAILSSNERNKANRN
jgi:GTP-binding protein